MKRYASFAVVILLASNVAAARSTQGARSVQVVNQEQVRWSSSAFAHVQFAAVQGNWNIPNAIYTVRFRMPTGSSFPLHYHGSDEVLTVVKGTFMFKRGINMSRTNGQAIHVGGVLYIPSNTRHWGWAVGETIVQINGIGPHSVHVLKP